MKLKDAKQDSRPFCRGWAPGAYMGTCLTCNEAFIGDKRATQCADCAYKRAEGGQAMIDTKELREIAKAATQGRWLHDPDIATGSDGSPYCQGHNITCANGDIVGVDGILGYRENDAIHIAAFDPPTVLAMLDEIDRLRALLGRAGKALVFYGEAHARTVAAEIEGWDFTTMEKVGPPPASRNPHGFQLIEGGVHG